VEPQVTDPSVHRRTWAARGAIALTTLLAAAWAWPTSALSWHFFPTGATALFGPSGLHLYVDHPELQVGPVAFVVAWLLSEDPTTPVGTDPRWVSTLPG